MSNSSTFDDSSSSSTTSSLSTSSLSTSTLPSSDSSNSSDARQGNENKTVEPQIAAAVTNSDGNKAPVTAENDDYLYEDILGEALDENDDDLDDRKHNTVAVDQPVSSSNKSGSACGSETCAALLSYLRTTISDRDRTISDLDDQLVKLKEKYVAELQKLTMENESLQKQFSVAKLQAARLRTELRDWLRLPLNRTIVALKKSANLKSVSEVIELAPALGNSGESENQPEIAELEQRLKAYHSMLKAKTNQVNNPDSDNSHDSIVSLPSSLKSGASFQGSELVVKVAKEKAKEVAEAEIEEGEVSSEDEAEKVVQVEETKKKKKHHFEKVEHKKKHHKEKPVKSKKESREEKSVVPEPSASSPVIRPPPQPQQSSGEWIGLLRKHVGGAWPSKKPDEKPSIEKRLGARPVWKLDKGDRGGSRHRYHDDRRSRSINVDLPQQQENSQSSSNSTLPPVVVESKLVPVVNKKRDEDRSKERRDKSHRDENRAGISTKSKAASPPNRRSKEFAQNDNNNRSTRKRSRSRDKDREGSHSKLRKAKPAEGTLPTKDDHRHHGSSSHHRRH